MCNIGKLKKIIVYRLGLNTYFCYFVLTNTTVYYLIRINFCMFDIANLNSANL